MSSRRIIDTIREFSNVIKKESSIDCYRVVGAPFNVVMIPPEGRFGPIFGHVVISSGKAYYPVKKKKDFQPLSDMVLEYKNFQPVLIIRFSGRAGPGDRSVKWVITKITTQGPPKVIYRPNAPDNIVYL